MSRRRVVAAASIAAVTIAVAVATVATRPSFATCGPGFVRTDSRCCPPSSGALRGDDHAGRCAFSGSTCPQPLVLTAHGCDEPEQDVVEVPPVIVTIGPSDWEAEGRISARRVEVSRFWLDRFEVSIGRACDSMSLAKASYCTARDGDAARAAFGVPLTAAREYCRARGGRLPTDDEWLAAAAGDRPRRYPWGDTGAVCRRAAWGLASGPCGEGAAGPDTVGAHPTGATPLGIHDLAGNVAEWVERCAPGSTRQDGSSDCGGSGKGWVRGGSWRSALATELRTWLPQEVAASSEDPMIGFRCAYDRVR